MHVHACVAMWWVWWPVKGDRKQQRVSRCEPQHLWVPRALKGLGKAFSPFPERSRAWA